MLPRSHSCFLMNSMWVFQRTNPQAIHIFEIQLMRKLQLQQHCLFFNNLLSQLTSVVFILELQILYSCHSTEGSEPYLLGTSCTICTFNFCFQSPVKEFQSVLLITSKKCTRWRTFHYNFCQKVSIAIAFGKIFLDAVSFTTYMFNTHASIHNMLHFIVVAGF